MKLVEATIDDIPVLAIHHRMMFEEIWEQKGGALETSRAGELESAYRRKLEDQLPTGTCRAWVVQSGARIVASGAVTIVSLVPVPTDTNHRVAYLHSIYTEKTHRNRTCARKIVDQAIDFCKQNGIHRITLNASDAGRPIYEKAGFVSAPETMRLLIP